MPAKKLTAKQLEALRKGREMRKKNGSSSRPKAPKANGIPTIAQLEKQKRYISREEYRRATKTTPTYGTLSAYSRRRTRKVQV